MGSFLTEISVRKNISNGKKTIRQLALIDFLTEIFIRNNNILNRFSIRIPFTNDLFSNNF